MYFAHLGNRERQFGPNNAKQQAGDPHQRWQVLDRGK